MLYLSKDGDDLRDGPFDPRKISQLKTYKNYPMKTSLINKYCIGYHGFKTDVPEVTVPELSKHY